jgi:hypothetical protein
MYSAILNILFLSVILLLSGCKTGEETISGPEKDNKLSGGINDLGLFATIGNTTPEKVTDLSQVVSEMEARASIQSFVLQRTQIQMNSQDQIDVELEKIPKKFRFTNVYQQKLKELQDQQQVHKEQLKSYHKELDLLADKYRKYQERTSSGVWKLSEFYSAFGPDVDPRDTQQWDAYIANLEDWIQENPASPTPRIALAWTLIKRAWAHRTTLPAQHVDPEAWKAYEYYVSQAKNYLQQNKALTSQDPHWYDVMATVAMAEGWPLEEYIELIDEGTTRYPYYYGIYFAGANYLLPRWHGSFEKLDAFANAAVEKTREKDKNGLYARIYWSASGTIKKHRLFSESAVKWEKMRQGIFDVLEQYPDQWNINNFAYFSCLAKDKEATKKLTGMVTVPIRHVWEADEVYDACKNWADGKDSGLLDMIMGAR